jgi:restriction endonuclease Mrr
MQALKSTKFEEFCVQQLIRYGMHLRKRNTSSNDAGIDLIGSWNIGHEGNRGLIEKSSLYLSVSPYQIQILGQCKGELKKVGPNYIREFEGAIQGYCQTLEAKESNCSISEVLGVFCSTSGFSTKAIEYSMNSSTNMLLLHFNTAENGIDSILLNRTATQRLQITVLK